MNILNKLKAFFKEYTEELLYKVQWPSWPELQGSTVTVLIASLLIAMVIAIMDFGFKAVMSGLYSIVGGLFA